MRAQRPHHAAVAAVRRPVVRFDVASSAVGASPMPWWCSPAGIVLGFILPTIVLIGLAGEMQLSTLTVRGVRFLDTYAMLLAALMLTPVILGGWIGSQLGPLPRAVSLAEVRRWDRTAAVMVSLALVGYVFLFKDLAAQPLLLWQLVSGAVRVTRQELGVSAGASSLVNVVQVFYGIYALRIVATPSRPVPRWMHYVVALLAVLTIVRVQVYSERLALMEMMVPMGVAMGRWLMTRRQTPLRVLAQLGPYAALPLLLLYFGVAEYFRSWSAPAYQGKSGFWDFVLGRFLSYYVTSLNNGAGVVATTPEATWKFEHVMEWAHRAPFGLGTWFSDYVGFNAEAKSSFQWFLRTYADVEFNSNSGLFVPVADLGVFVALVYWLMVGLAAGMAFRSYRHGRLTGALFLPLFFIALLEIYRYPFLGQPRAFTWTLGILMALVLVQVLAWLRYGEEGPKANAPVGSMRRRKNETARAAAGAATSIATSIPAQDA